jgi:predicted DsbA family dithiol-disulfide isomerase
MAENMIATARAEGLVMDYERGLSVNTLDAHRLLRLAEREYGLEVQRTLAARLFAAHFSEGRNVGDVDTLAKLAAEVGVDEQRARAYLAGAEGLSEVVGEIAEARELGITAVPTFVFDEKYAIPGAQPTSVFLRALEDISRETAAANASSDVSCTDDGCAV